MIIEYLRLEVWHLYAIGHYASTFSRGRYFRFSRNLKNYLLLLQSSKKVHDKIVLEVRIKL